MMQVRASGLRLALYVLSVVSDGNAGIVGRQLTAIEVVELRGVRLLQADIVDGALLGAFKQRQLDIVDVWCEAHRIAEAYDVVARLHGHLHFLCAPLVVPSSAVQVVEEALVLAVDVELQVSVLCP